MDLDVRTSNPAAPPPGRVPGIIDGAMAIWPEADGRVSLRVTVGAESRRASECDLFELIIDAGCIAGITRALAGRGSGPGQDHDRMPLFPCRVGVGRSTL